MQWKQFKDSFYQSLGNHSEDLESIHLGITYASHF